MKTKLFDTMLYVVYVDAGDISGKCSWLLPHPVSGSWLAVRDGKLYIDGT